MNKILLGTTTLFSAVSLYAGAAIAGSPEVTVGGYVDFQYGHIDQDTFFRTDDGGSDDDVHHRENRFSDEAEVHVKVEGQMDNGIGYGAVIELLGNVSSPADDDGVNSDKTFIWVDTQYGRVEFGSLSGPEHVLKVDASTFARATGGIDGDWYRYVDTAGTTSADFSTLFILRPDLPSQHARGPREDANKINYYTPRIAGFQAGVSHVIDQGDTGTTASFTDQDSNYDHVWSGGINYTNQFDEVNLAISLTGETGEEERGITGSIENLSAYALGFNVAYRGFTVGGSWGDWNNSDQSLTSTGEGTFWTGGVSYVHGPYGLSMTYMGSDFQHHKFDNLVFGADYQLAPGFVPYIELSMFDLDESGTTTDNDGAVLLIGSQLTF